jgi:hypothetical protein
VNARAALLDESILTGESVPVDKGDGDEAFSGTLLVRGKTVLEVTRTGASINWDARSLDGSWPSRGCWACSASPPRGSSARQR